MVGDVVMLSAGDEVCADGVIFEKNDIGISEASLTGESVLKRKGDFVYGEGEESAEQQEAEPLPEIGRKNS